jgi:hypothetical protein
MDRLKMNTSSFKYPRIKIEKFFFTKIEEVSIKNGLDKLESMISNRARSIFSISKEGEIFSGSLKIESFYLYIYGKSSTSMGLFCKLCKIMKIKIRERSKITKEMFVPKRLLFLHKNV